MLTCSDNAYTDSGSSPPERNLWVAVLLQALRDLWLVEVRTKGLTGIRRDAEDFIFSPYFLQVCRRADIDPEWFRENVRRLLDLYPFPARPPHIFDKVSRDDDGQNYLRSLLGRYRMTQHERSEDAA